MTSATHIKTDDEHVIALNDLHVLVSGDNRKGWFAQGIEIDYFACGETLHDVQENFSVGFKLTLEEYLQRYGSIERFLRYAPLDKMTDVLDSKKYVFSNVSTFQIEKDENYLLPFRNFCFVKRELKEAA